MCNLDLQLEHLIMELFVFSGFWAQEWIDEVRQVLTVERSNT